MNAEGIVQLEAFYFEAQLATLNRSARVVPNEVSSNMFVLEYVSSSSEFRNLKLVNGYVNSKTGFFSGMVTIWKHGAPVWSMHYGGRYNEAEIAFLALALRASCQAKVFLGGRGPEAFVGEDEFEGILYRNLVLENGGFRAFRGFESISREGSKKAPGYCNYSGYLFEVYGDGKNEPE